MYEDAGGSNFYRLEDIKYLHENARVKPRVVQNQFYSESGYDVEIRAFYLENDIEYQSFWTLTANPDAVGSRPVRDVARRSGLSPEGVCRDFRKFFTPLCSEMDYLGGVQNLN